jgi:hypothetical protein
MTTMTTSINPSIMAAARASAPKSKTADLVSNSEFGGDLTASPPASAVSRRKGLLSQLPGHFAAWLPVEPNALCQP